MADPTVRTKLSFQQIFQSAFDPDLERLRVDTSATVEAGQMEVVITHVSDSIRLGDGTTLAGVTLDNELKISDSAARSSLSSIDTKLSGSLSVMGTFFQATQPISALSLPLPVGAASATKQDTANTSLNSIDNKLSGTIAISAASLPLPTDAATSAKQDTGNTSLGSIDTKLSSQATAAKQDTGNTSVGSIDTKTMADTSATATLANLAASASNQTLLASNTSRKGAIVYNDSTSGAYLKYGATATSTSFTYWVPAGAIWEMPTRPLYTGIIDIIWMTATGSARTTELS